MNTYNTEIAFRPIDNQRLSNLCGPIDENLRQLESAFDVMIQHRGEKFVISGKQELVRKTVNLLEHLYNTHSHQQQIEVDDIQLSIIESQKRELSHVVGHINEPVLMTRKTGLRSRTERQAKYLANIQQFDITFSIGPAGTGKTYLAVASAVDAFERELVERIILTRPAVEAGERLGFLPGDLSQKVDPYLRPLYDALYDLMGTERVNRLFEQRNIEIAPLAFMRGRTLNNAFVILDEAQNTTPEQMKMFLTRIGIASKAVITGDLTQIDLPRGQQSGLKEASEILAGVSGIGFAKLSKEDIVRHPLVARIVEAYESKYRRKLDNHEKTR